MAPTEQELARKAEAAGGEAKDGGSGHRSGQEDHESQAGAKAVRLELPQPGTLLLTLASARTRVPGAAPGGTTPTGPPHPPGAKIVPTSVRGSSPTALNLTGSLGRPLTLNRTPFWEL